MDALVPAFIAALLVGIGDRPARIAAMLAMRGRAASIVSGLAIGHALAIAIAIAGATAIALSMSPNARGVLLAIALILAGLGALWPRKPVVPSSHAPLLAAATTGFLHGDTTAFLAFAFAVKGSTPILAGAGALAGALVMATVAITMAGAWQRLPLIALGRVVGGLLLATGLIIGSGALRLT